MPNAIALDALPTTRPSLSYLSIDEAPPERRAEVDDWRDYIPHNEIETLCLGECNAYKYAFATKSPRFDFDEPKRITSSYCPCQLSAA
jgi:hypothetical protein